MKNIFAIFIGFLFSCLIISIAFGANTEALLSLLPQSETQVLAATGQYQAVPLTTDGLNGEYEIRHIEKWCGQLKPCAVGYEVVYTNAQSQIKTEGSAGFENFTNDWTPVPDLTNTSNTPKL